MHCNNDTKNSIHSKGCFVKETDFGPSHIFHIARQLRNTTAKLNIIHIWNCSGRKGLVIVDSCLLHCLSRLRSKGRELRAAPSGLDSPSSWSLRAKRPSATRTVFRDLRHFLWWGDADMWNNFKYCCTELKFLWTWIHRHLLPWW